jgi:phosphohistidine phosphatase
MESNPLRSLYLVRHGDAKSEAEDPRRALTDEGRSSVEKMAIWAAGAGITVARIRHSGKLRAEQTAAIFAEHLHPPHGPVAVTGLAPNDDVRPIADLLARENEPVMLVGHLPFLGRLASHLVLGDAGCPIVHFPAAGFVGIGRQDGEWLVTCAMNPQLVRRAGTAGAEA